MSGALKFIGWLAIVAGFLVLLVDIGSQSADPSKSGGILLGIISLISGIITGVMFFASAEALNLLKEIRDNTKVSIKNPAD